MRNRINDERTLDMLRMRCEGVPLDTIAKFYTVTQATVRSITTRVRRDDEESSRDEDLSEDYW